MADQIEIADQIETLSAHCRPPLMDVDTKSRWLQSWCEDLAEFPSEVLKAGFRNWRRSENTKFPTPGQLLPMMRAAASRANGAGQESTEGAKAWEPISDDEYERLSLRDKIRHQRILASRAFGKAGPQCIGSNPVPADQMPPAWHAWKAMGRNHMAEVERLRKLLDRDELKDTS
jgi:hypothetical protein